VVPVAYSILANKKAPAGHGEHKPVVAPGGHAPAHGHAD
jgi:hypothetical protein